MASKGHSQYWMQSAGGNNVDEVMDIAKDNLGNIISAGYFSNTATFGQSTSFNLTAASVGTPDIFVYKTASNGGVLWSLKAGGTGSDRALSIACDNNGNSYITGFYYGSATFGSTTLTSVSNTQDIFVAKINSSGSFVWAKSFGGNKSEQGTGIAVDANGNVIVTGQFEGTATFGSQTLTSVVNPITTFSSFDIYTLKLDNSGNFIWVEQGAAEFNDRGMDVKADNQGNIFVTGQFSDTITFDNTYNNPIANAIFLIKYDANGVEQWFRKASGTYSMPYAITLDAAQNVYLTGDYQGNLLFWGPTNNFLNGTYTNKYFLAKYSNSGNYIQSAQAGSDSYVSGRDLAIDNAGHIYVYGEYGCRMDEFSAMYGTGTFNSIGYEDLFVAKYDANFNREWERNFGSQLRDKAHGIVIQNNNLPLIGGSYGQNINFPIGNSGFTITSYNNFNGCSSFTNSQYCSDLYYGYMANMHSYGFYDGFLSNVIDPTRQPYDYYHRSGTGCVRDELGVCITGSLIVNCPDTIKICQQGNIYSDTYCVDEGCSAPNHHFSWNGSLTDTSDVHFVNTSGYQSVTITTRDGCFSSEDTVYVEVNPYPIPLISDDYVVNTNSPPNAQPIIVCGKDSIILTGSNINGGSFNWSGNMGNASVFSNTDSTFLVTESSSLIFSVTTNKGCTRTNTINIIMYDSLPKLILKTNIPDSAEICQGSSVFLFAYDSLSNPNGLNPYSAIQYSFPHWYSSPSTSIISYGGTSQNNLCGAIYPNITAMYHLTDTVYVWNTCDTVKYVVHDSIYIKVNPKPTPYSASISGPTFICSGDTGFAVLNTNAPSYSWQGSNIISSLTNDTVYFVGPGNMYVYIPIVDSITGCTNQSYTYHNVIIKPDPLISTLPASGLICPNDSVKLQCNVLNGINYEWHGPMGIIGVNAPFVYTDVVGFYHCVVTDASGCVLTSNTIEVKQYNTPYLAVSPSNVLCPGQTATLTVVTNNPYGISWSFPLFGNSPTQTVNAAGTYNASANMCGIVTQMSTTIIMGNPVATITPNGSLTICPGDSVILTANSGMSSYQWLPNNSFNNTLVVNSAGTYTLQTVDAYGCIKNSTPVTVTVNNSVAAPNANSIQVCYGNSANLNATSSSPTIDWYTNSSGGAPIHTGNNYVLNNVVSNDTLWVASNNGSNCHSIRIPIIVTVVPSSLAPIISGDSVYCKGNTINLNSSFVSGANYQWNGPNGFVSNSQNISISTANSIHAGLYSLSLTGNGCVSPITSINIDVVDLSLPILVGDTTICEGLDISLQVSSGSIPFSSIWQDNFGNIYNLNNLFIPNVSFVNAGVYSVYNTYSGCNSDTLNVNVTILPLPQIIYPVINSPVCLGDSLVLVADTTNHLYQYSWQSPLGNNFVGDTIIIYPVTILDAGNYSLEAISGECGSSNYNLFADVLTLPQFNLGNDTTICDSQPITLVAPVSSSYIWSTGQTSQSITTNFNGDILLTVRDSNNCSYTDTLHITSLTCESEAPNVFTPNGDGENDKFYLTGDNLKEVFCEIFDRWGNKIYTIAQADAAWDGTNQNTGLKMPQGTYYFVGSVLQTNDVRRNIHGFVELIR